MTTGHTTKLQHWLTLARRGDTDARNEVIAHTCERLRLLTRRMLRGYPSVNRWSQTDDVLQNAMLRLHRSLLDVHPESPRQFYGLATTQIRRELIDLSRHFNGPEGLGANHHTDDGELIGAKPSEGVEPENLESWSKYHEAVENLPEEQREVVSLLWYEDMSQPEAADILGISLATLKRRWQAARLKLFDQLKDLDFE
jgi:RNA polymerase sigma factor (sigma-70 family)